jgi:uncharacterized RDD family membrane protein YckC
MHYAGFWIRAFATLVDVAALWFAEAAVVFVLWEGGLLPLTEKELGEGLGLFLAVIFGVFPAWPYFTILECSRKQSTFGKRLVGLQVTDLEGERIGFIRANARYWSKVLSWLPLFAGFIAIAFSSRKQGLHDVIAGTLVVRT